MLNLPPELIKDPVSLFWTVCAALGIVLGSAVTYVIRNRQADKAPAVGTTKAATDVIVSSGSFLDLAEFREFKADVKRIAVAAETIAKIHHERTQDEESEDRIYRVMRILDRERDRQRPEERRGRRRDDDNIR